MSQSILLKPHQDKRLKQGHCWIYSNEIDSEKTPLKNLAPGETVEVLNHSGKWLGWAYANPHSLITARLISRNKKYPLNQSLITHRIKIALSLRERLYQQPFYRLIFSEADGLPGLIVDRYGDYLAIQITTAGMEQQKDNILGALEKVLKPEGMVFRNDTQSRTQEGLDLYKTTAFGSVPETVKVFEGESVFETSIFEGQKTGWFYDQALNRKNLLKYVAGKRVLDVCSYIGAWSIGAARAGAQEVVAVDSSASALDRLENNAELNGVSEKTLILEGDAFDALKALKKDKEHFDVVVLDPPAFIKKRKDLKTGTIAYQRLNEAAMPLIGKDGILVSASCSFHMEKQPFLTTVQKAARHTDRFLQLIEQGQQAPDHPVHPAIPETSYLKTSFFRVLSGYDY